MRVVVLSVVIVPVFHTMVLEIHIVKYAGNTQRKTICDSDKNLSASDTRVGETS